MRLLLTISLFPIITKLFEKLIIKRPKIIVSNHLLPQFGFKDKHSTIDQVHHLTDKIEAVMEDKKVCSAVLLDVSQAFDRARETSVQA